MNNINIQPQEKFQQQDRVISSPMYLAPNRQVFSQRAERFEQLAEQSQQSKQLLQKFNLISQAQHKSFNKLIDENIMVEQAVVQLEHIFDNKLDLLHQIYQQILTQLQAEQLNIDLQQYQNLVAITSGQLLQQVQHIFEQPITQTKDYWFFVLTAAAMQVLLTYHAYAQTQPFNKHTEEDLCPCCGVTAVASVVKTGELNNLRYLHCAWCNCQWNLIRAKCTFCGDSQTISLQKIEQQPQGALHGARAESCDKCHSYRKLFMQTQEYQADPIADDLASLVLDVLVAENGYQRGGANPFVPVE